MANRVSIYTFLHYFLPGHKSGGPIKSVHNMGRLLSQTFNFKLITMANDIDGTEYDTVLSDNWSDFEEFKIFYIRKFMSSYIKIFRSIMRDQESYIYLNSFFDMKFSIVPIIINLFLSKRIILAPRGEFSEGALNIKSQKKRTYIFISRLLGFYKNIIWHASTELEGSDIKRIFPAAQVRIANDLNMIDTNIVSKQDNNNIIFLSRICEKKNLLTAINILKSVKSEVTFNIYGMVEDESYWILCLNELKNLPSNIKFSYKGEVLPEEVQSSFAANSLFLFPTFGENFGHVIAESLASGVPCLLSNTTPWLDLEKHHAGWVFALNDLNRFSNTIDYYFNLSQEERLNYSQKAKDYGVRASNVEIDIEKNLELFS